MYAQEHVQMMWKVYFPTSYVFPPFTQMADHTDVLRGIQRAPRVQYPVLTPNMQGFQDAVSIHFQFSAMISAIGHNMFTRACRVQLTVGTTFFFLFSFC